MNDPHVTPQKLAERKAREARLAKSLRDNLRRRKEQARAQEEQPAARARRTNSKVPDGDGEPPA